MVKLSISIVNDLYPASYIRCMKLGAFESRLTGPLFTTEKLASSISTHTHAHKPQTFQKNQRKSQPCDISAREIIIIWHRHHHTFCRPPLPPSSSRNFPSLNPCNRPRFCSAAGSGEGSPPTVAAVRFARRCWGCIVIGRSC